MADDTIDSLKIDVVESGTEKAVEKLQSLLKTLRAIKNVSSSKGSSQTSFEKPAEAASAIDSQGIDKLHKLTQSIKELSQVSKLKISSSIAKQITRIGKAVDGLKSIDMSKLTEITSGIKALRDSGIDSMNFTSPKVDTSGMSQGETVSPAIDVTPDVSGMTTFTSEVSKARSGVSKLNGHLENMKKILGSLRLKEYFSDAGKKIGDAANKTKQFFSSIARIAKYRLIRSALSAIAKGLKEGIDNLYQYDKLSKGTFSNSLNSMATDSLYLKNSLATIAAPLINTLAPAIDFIVDKWVELNNAVSQFIARVTGQKTWKKAIRYPTEYAEATDKATNANERLKRSILGIDELNVLTDNSTFSSGVGSGSSANYKEMFEDVALDDNVSDFIKNLAITVGDVFFDWSDLTGEQIAEKIIVGLGGLLGAVVGFSFGGVPGAIVGAIAGVALSTVFSSLLFDHDGKISQKEVGKMILAAANGLMGAIVGFSLGGVPGAIIGTATGCGMSLLFSKLLFDDDKKLKSEEITKMVIQVIGGLVGTIVGFSIGGKIGSLVGTLTGNGLALLFTKMTFDNNGKLSTEEISSMVIQAVLGLVGTVAGFAVGGKVGALIGTLTGNGLALLFSKFTFNNDGKIEDSEAVSMLVAVLNGAIGGIIGFAAGGPAGAIVGTIAGVSLSVVFTNFVLKDDFDLGGTVTGWLQKFLSLFTDDNAKKQSSETGQAIGMNVVSGFDALDKSEMTNSIQRVLSLSSNPTAKSNFNSAGKSMANETVSGFKSNNFSGLPSAVTGSLTSKDAKTRYSASGITVASNVKSGMSFSGVDSKVTSALGNKDAKNNYTESGKTIASKVKSGFTFSSLYSKITTTLTGKTAKSEYQSTGSSAASNFSSGFKNNGFSSLYTTIKNAIFGKSTDYTGSGKSSASSFSTGFQTELNKNTFKVKVDLTADQAKILNANGSIHISASGKAHGGGGAKFADGGYPPMGDIFIANEAGPELVGRIGRRTAVANQDQIVASVSSGVSQGVYEANAQQNALLREQNELLRKLLAKDTTATISTGQITSALDRANRRNGKVTVPVG